VSSSAGVTLGKLVVLNLIYDLTAGCTSIVAQTSAGRMLHARNLDYGKSLTYLSLLCYACVPCALYRYARFT
jgi:penicillin V acylase-like amidase (Ntn superfamily)